MAPKLTKGSSHSSTSSANQNRFKTIVIFLTLIVLSLSQIYRNDIRLQAYWTSSRLENFNAVSQNIFGNGNITDASNNQTNTYRRPLAAGLSCAKYGGPADEVASEMVYWKDIPSDANFLSPFHKTGPDVKYLTFELDQGGMNNIRMSAETAVAMAYTMKRTLVLPPIRAINAMDKDTGGQKRLFSLSELFSFESIQREHAHFEIITFDEFLAREAMTGKLRDKATGLVSFPPNNRTDWNGEEGRDPRKELNYWMRSVTVNPIWNYRKCVAAFAAQPGAEAVKRLPEILAEALNLRTSKAATVTSVNATPPRRLREMLAHRSSLCIYDEAMQNASVIHLMGDFGSGARLLVHFYAFLFFEDWRQDLWTKRFLRDHFRYHDAIQCAAARVVNAIREKSRGHGNIHGVFDTFHIRRGDLPYEDARVDASVIFKNTMDVLEFNSTLYIATDERNKTFFDIFHQHYHLYFLDDFAHLLEDVNTNFYGLLDQRIASRGRTFIGTYFSTFSGYINRMRGYHSQAEKGKGYESGLIDSFHYSPVKFKYAYRHYQSVATPLWTREFPVAWRDLDREFE